MLQRINASEALGRSFKTLESQLDTLVDSTEGLAHLQASALYDLFKAQFMFVSECINADVDAYNELLVTVTERDSKIERMMADNKVMYSDNKTLVNLAKDLRDEVAKLNNLKAQIENQRDNYKKEADELRTLRNDFRRLSNQLERNKESNTSLQAKVNQLEQKNSQQKSHIRQVDDRNTYLIKLHNAIRQMMLVEGLAPEQDITIDKDTFFIYRKPINSFDGFKFEKDSLQPSRDHQYFLHVQTSFGVHRDIIPMEDGRIFVPPAKPLPKAFLKIIQDEFEKETLFAPNYTPKFQTQALQQIFAEVELVTQGVR